MRTLAQLVLLTTSLLVGTLAQAKSPAAEALARQDWASVPLSDQPYVRYLTLPYHDPFGPDYHAALSFLIPSASQSLVLNHQLPVRVAPNVYRIDLRSLSWSPLNFINAIESHPYSLKPNPLCIRADWFLANLADASRSPLYNRLLFDQTKPPTTLTDSLKLLAVNRDATRRLGLEFGQVETASKVATNRTRILEFFSREGGYATGTKDFLKITADNSPLELIDQKGLKHDASEWIVGLPKVWYARRDDRRDIRTAGRGSLQVYLLANGQDQLQVEAPNSIVEDHSRFSGLASIRTPGSCVQCHASGLNTPSVNGLTRLLEAGAELRTYDASNAEALERFHLTDSARYIERANEDFAAAVLACNGLSPEENAANFTACIEDYRREVTLVAAAGELNCSPDELRNAIAYASEANQKVGSHVAGLAHGIPLARDTWESVYSRVDAYLQAWRKTHE